MFSSDPKPQRCTTLLTIPETAAELRTSTRTVWRLLAQNALKKVQVHRGVRVTSESLERFCNRGGSR